MEAKKLSLPLTDEDIINLSAGDRVLLYGNVLAARDAAHKRLIECIENDEPLPINITGSIIYYVGPTPARKGAVIGAAGPTTSGRMDKYTPQLIERGLKGMIGKGYRNEEVKSAIKEHTAVYFAAVGGSGALLSQSIVEEKIVAYEELGPEAIRELTLDGFPVTVINDSEGLDLYEIGKEEYKK
ncbi:fumarate hydratase [Geomicrobium sp. JCM 19037]|uniref:Fe-S-containing hydro-lyase n=1 Tax=unclassified Geomicrobium TaxID=2628951 RepID=UPI00045F25D1|nr:Fe-S-containing hydro-lyase [Geomicrobium sp. JCM 19037]GAK04912.1 fumarate hydratase [Geomicrobium sp. JCM 19037]